jgi:hypothetical protein
MPAPFQSSFQTFATDFLPVTGILDASITGLTVLDPTENEETQLLEDDDPFDVKVDWTLTGAALCSLGGTWLVDLFINSIDGLHPGGRITPSPGPVPVPVVGCQTNYTTTFHILANTVLDGVYQLMVTINHSPQGATTPPPLSQQLTENVGFAQSAPIKVTKIVNEPGVPD